MITAMLFVLVAASAGSSPSAEAIAACAVERAARWKEVDPEAQFRGSLWSRVEKLDSNGDIVDEEERLYDSFPVEGAVYRRLIKKNGRPLSVEEENEEGERARKFRDSPGDAERIHLDGDLVARYRLDLVGVQEVHGRPAYVLSFEPRPGRLPTQRRIDAVLNRIHGSVWIDVALCEVARVDFELVEKIKLWWGVLASVSDMSGSVERRPADGAVWLPARLDLRTKGRSVFKRFHFQEHVEWRGFRRLF